MRTREMEILNDTLKIFEEGFYIKEGEKKDIKLSKKELHASNVLLPNQVSNICECLNKKKCNEEESKYFCINKDSFSAALSIKERKPDERVLVLNFANPVNPGGGVRPAHEHRCFAEGKASILVPISEMIPMAVKSLRIPGAVWRMASSC